MVESWLVCGTRGKFDKSFVKAELDKLLKEKRQTDTVFWKPDNLIEGCCPDSADVYAEEWAKENEINLLHHPSTTGNYLKRNIEMVRKCDLVIAFWDGFSYGTSQAIAHAVLNNKKIKIISLTEQNKMLGGK